MTGAVPIVSVVMAAYNGAALIEETLASVSRQTMDAFEVIVVDDCSTDATRDVVARWEDPRVRLIALPRNGGPVRARNHALAHARGRYIAALDQDDLCHPDRFARQVAFLDANTDVALVGTATQVLSASGIAPSTHPRTMTPALIGWLLRFSNPLVWSSVMVRGSVARALDPFTRPDMLYAEDFDLYHRAAAVGQIARIDAPLVTYRSHAGGCSQRYEEVMLASAERVLASALHETFGGMAAGAARLFVRHLMHGAPVPDGETLGRLAALLDHARLRYLAATRADATDRRLIARETRRVWAGVLRAGLRQGTIGLRDAIAAGPVASVARVDRLAWSRMVGQVRPWLTAS
jgi:glycosyltransferase involved in cell wall biosynthesis